MFSLCQYVCAPVECMAAGAYCPSPIAVTVSTRGLPWNVTITICQWSHVDKTKQCYIVQALLTAGTARHQRRMSTHSKRLTRKGTAVPCSPATLGLGKIPNIFSNTVSGPSRSSNTKFFTRIESTIYKCTYRRQSLTGASPINRGREWTYLELGDRKPLSKTCPRAVDESQQMPVSLDLFRPARNAVVADPPFRLELFGVRTPQRRRAVHGRH